MQPASSTLLGAGVLGDGLGTLTDGVLGKLTGQQKAHSGLNLSAGDGGPAVVVSQTGGLGSDPLEDVVDERVHDTHGLAADAGVGVYLLQHLVDVDGVRLPPPPPAFFVRGTGGLGLGNGLLCSLRRWFWTHSDSSSEWWQTARRALYIATSGLRRGARAIENAAWTLPILSWGRPFSHVIWCCVT